MLIAHHHSHQLAPALFPHQEAQRQLPRPRLGRLYPRLTHTLQMQRWRVHQLRIREIDHPLLRPRTPLLLDLLKHNLALIFQWPLLEIGGHVHLAPGELATPSLSTYANSPLRHLLALFLQHHHTFLIFFIFLSQLWVRIAREHERRRDRFRGLGCREGRGAGGETTGWRWGLAEWHEA